MFFLKALQVDVVGFIEQGGRILKSLWQPGLCVLSSFPSFGVYPLKDKDRLEFFRYPQGEETSFKSRTV